MRSVFSGVAAASAIFSCSGCVAHILAKRIVSAPNLAGIPAPYNNPEILANVDAMCVARWKTNVGPPDADIAVAVINPADFHLQWDVKESREGAKSGVEVTINWSKPDITDARYAVSPKGTIVLLHGILMTRETMLPWAIYFAQQQYRVVLVDLRGHGRSTGKRIGFGTWEPTDLVKVTDELERRKLLAGKLGVLGMSYGAAMGLQWAARDPRVATVIALAPYSEPRAAILGFARGFDPGGAGRLSDKTFAAANTEAESIAGIRWDDLNVVDAVRRLHVPVLFFHGDHDTWILPSNSAMLYQAAPAGSQRILVPNTDHVALQLRSDLVGPRALSWFNEHVGDRDAPETVRRVSAAGEP